MLSRDSLRPYQHTLLDYGHANPRCGLFAGMGAGKTGVAGTLFRDLYDRFECHKALVVSTVSNVVATWPLDLQQWDHLKDLTLTILREPDTKTINTYLDEQWRKKKPKLVDEWTKKHGAGKVPALTKEWRTRWFDKQRARWYRAKSQENTHIHLINAENFALLCAEMDEKYWSYDLVIFDESTLFAGYNAKRFTEFQRIAHLPSRVVLLSGSAFSRGSEAVWTQMWLLDGGKRLGTTITEFRERFRKPTRIQHVYEDLPDTMDRVKAAVADICIYIDPTKHMQVCEDIHVDKFITLNAKEAKQMQQLEDELFLLLDSGDAIEPANAAVLSNKLRQFANGFMYTDKEGAYAEVHQHKLKLVAEMVDEINAPVIIAYEFKADRERLCRLFPQAKVFDKTKAMVAAWNDGKIPILLMNPQSAAHGLSLQYGGHHMIWLNPTWSLELTEQLEARIGKVRQAQAGFERPAYFYRILEPSEQRVLKRIAERKAFQQILHDHIEAEYA